MGIVIYTTEATSNDPAVTKITPCAVQHVEGCPCGKPGWPDTSRTELTPECVAAKPDQPWTGCRVGYHHHSYVGQVVELRERNGYDDSDFYAEVWNPETKERKSIQYATTRGWTYFNGASVDGDVEGYAKWLEECQELARKERLEREAKAKAKLPEKGKTVRVVSKRSKVPAGTEGVVVWFGKSSYARPHYYRNPYAGLLYTQSESTLQDLGDYRVGIKTPTGTVFCGAKCVEVVS